MSEYCVKYLYKHILRRFVYWVSLSLGINIFVGNWVLYVNKRRDYPPYICFVQNETTVAALRACDTDHVNKYGCLVDGCVL